DHDEGQNGERNQRQPRIHLQHDPDDADQNKNVLKDRDHARGKHLVQRVDVGRHARDQASYRILVVEADMQTLQMAEDLAAQVEHDLLTGPLHEVGLQVLEREAEHQQADVESADLRDADQGFIAEETIDRSLEAGDGREVTVDDDMREVRP